MSTVQDVCLTTDVWTESHNTKSFLALAAHYSYEDQPKYVMIGVEKLTGHQAAEYIQEKLVDLHATDLT